MAVLTRTQVIRKPIAVVFDAVIHVEDFPKWNPTTKGARKLTAGEIGLGTTFELDIKGFGKTLQHVGEFEPNKRFRIVPEIKSLGGGHRFLFTAQGDATRIDHELEMTAKGAFKLFAPLMGMVGRKNLRDTANALQRYIESA
jgi:hypothetical protein